MKNFYFILCFLLLVKITQGQESIIGGQFLNPTTGGISCPGSTTTYSIADFSISTVYKWKITKGKVNGQTEVCGTSINVVWDTDLDANGKLELYRVASCNTAISGSPVATLNVRKLNYGPATFTSKNVSECGTPVTSLICGTAQTITVAFWYLRNGTDYGNYTLWTAVNNASSVSVPTGWTVNSVAKSASDIDCSSLFSGLGYKFDVVTLTIHTDGIHAGQVKFRVKATCDGNYNGAYGDWTTNDMAFPAVDITQNNAPIIFCNSAGSNTVMVSSTKATSYSWTVPAGYLINGTSTSLTTASNSVTITSPTASANGTAEVTGLSSCGNSLPISIPLYYGPQDPGIVTYGGNAPPGRFMVSVDPVIGATSYNWYVNAVFKGNTTLPRIVLPNSVLICGVDNYFAAESVGQCGTSNQSFMSVYDPLACGGGASLSIYPNPSSNAINVAYNQDSLNQAQLLKSTQPVTFSVILYDNKGKVINAASTKINDILTINTQRIPDGVYYIHVNNGGKTIKRQVIIKH